MHKKIYGSLLNALFFFCVCSLLINIYLYFQLPTNLATPFKQETNWKKKTDRYLDEIYYQLGENHPGVISVDEENVHFRTWLDLGYKKAKDLANNVDNYLGCRAVCLWYINKLQDARTRLYFSQEYNPTVEWPGFLLRYQDGKFFISEVDKDLRFENLPSEGWEVVACDGIKPEILMKQSILQYLGNARFEKSWILHSSHLLKYEEGNPWMKKFHTLTIRKGEELRSYPLEYQTIDLLDWERLHLKSLDPWFIHEETWGVKEFAKGAYWVPLHNFNKLLYYDEQQHVDAFQQMLQTLENIQNPKVFVLDLRNNMGGRSDIGDKVLEALFGREYVNEKLYHYRKSQVHAWRVSEDNYLFIKDRNLLKNIGKFKKQLNKRYAFYHEVSRPILPQRLSRSRFNLQQVRVYVLTDPWTAGGALDFFKKLHILTKPIHVGRPTLGEAVYFCNRQQVLDEDGITLSFPIVYRENFAEDANKVYKPRFKFNESFVNQEVFQKAIEKWILNIDREITLGKS